MDYLVNSPSTPVMVILTPVVTITLVTIFKSFIKKRNDRLYEPTRLNLQPSEFHMLESTLNEPINNRLFKAGKMLIELHDANKGAARQASSMLTDEVPEFEEHEYVEQGTSDWAEGRRQGDIKW